VEVETVGKEEREEEGQDRERDEAGEKEDGKEN